MPRAPSCSRLIRTGVAGAIAIAFSASAFGQQSGGNQVYRYEDAQGRVVYSDRPPPSDARKAESKRVGANFVETDVTPLATQQATERFPVLQVGDKLVAKGYNEARWTTMLDEAGYPKAPPPRRTAAGGPRAPEPPRAEAQTVAPPPKGGGYPAQ